MQALAIAKASDVRFGPFDIPLGHHIKARQMPTTTTVNMFFLGNFTDVDTNEGNNTIENGGALLGNHGRPFTISVTENDQDDDGVIMDDESNRGDDSIAYDRGLGEQTVELDSTSQYEATLTLGDGSVETVSIAVLQMANGDVFIRDAGNQLDNLNIQNLELTSLVDSDYVGERTGNSIENTKMVCFVQGTLIDTKRGATPVETLSIGDLVFTANGEYQPIRWIGSGELRRPGKHAPIVISENALGSGVPARALLVSPQHRILVASQIAERMFGRREVLVPALRLLEIDGIYQASASRNVRYWHILTEHHQLIRANGTWAETLFPGPQALKSLSAQARDEINDILPMLYSETIFVNYEKARFEPTPSKQKRLVMRHHRNAKPLFDLRRSESPAPSCNA